MRIYHYRKQIIVFSLIFLVFMFSSPLFSQVNTKRYSIKDLDLSLTKLEATFYHYPSLPVKGQEIKFIDRSSGKPERWLWSFGDGETSTEINPLHTYGIPNSYFVTLKITRGKISSFKSETILIRVSENSDATKLSADFVYEPLVVQAGEAVQFIDKSTGNPTKRIWQFGYFDFSLLTNPVKVFYSGGTYKVSLTVKNDSGSDRIDKYVKVDSAPMDKNIAKSCSLADVKAAIATAKAGDTVVVPNGTATWGSQLYITKGITLKA
ncbi:MAG: PKD domain-containing protein, partial [Candidatus Aminicenantales bacterium]